MLLKYVSMKKNFFLQYIYQETQMNNRTSEPAVANMVLCANYRVIHKELNTFKLYYPVVPAIVGNVYNFQGTTFRKD